MCEGGKQYSPCGPPCEQTCENIDDEPDELCKSHNCIEGCFCPEGSVDQGRYMLYIYCFNIGLPYRNSN